MKKYAIAFLSLLLVVSLPFAAHANIVTATGKYIINAVKHAPGGAKVEATNTATAAKHAIKHGVSAADLGKSIGAGIVGFGVGTGAGLAFKAITGLALDAVDWVLDPANNSIKYTAPDSGSGSAAGAPSGANFNYDINYSETTQKWHGPTAKIVGSTPQQACASYPGESNWHNVGAFNVTKLKGECWFAFKDSGIPAYNPNATTQKSIPIDTVAAQVIANAEAGNPAAQKAVEDYVTNLAKEGKLDAELDNATDITEPENPEEPNPDEPQQCPSGTVKVDNVCVKIPDSEIEPPTEGEEPLFCDSSEFTKKVCDWIDWTQTEHDEPDAGKVDIKDKSEDLSIDNDRIDFSNQCPAPTPIVTSVGGFPVSTELNYQPLCDFFTMLNPFVIGMGGISSALIIAGGARRG